MMTFMKLIQNIFDKISKGIDDKKKNRKRTQRSVYVKYLHVELQVYDSLQLSFYR